MFCVCMGLGYLFGQGCFVCCVGKKLRGPWFGVEQMCVDRVMQNYHLMNGRPSTAHLEYGAARLNRNREFSLAYKTRTTPGQYKI